MNQAILYSRLGQLMARRADCMEAVERLSASHDNTSSSMDRARRDYEETLRAIEEVNLLIDAAEKLNKNRIQQ